MKIFILGALLLFVCYFPASGAIAAQVPLSIAGIDTGLLEFGRILILLGTCQLAADLIAVPWSRYRTASRWSLRLAFGLLAMFGGSLFLHSWALLLAIPAVVYFDISKK